MTAKFFVDTNVLLYAGSKAVDGIAFSAQVLQEFYAVAVSKQRLGMTHDEAVAVLRSLTAFPVCAITHELVIEAADLRQRCQLSYWDAAILAAAKRLGCDTVYSEDLNAGQSYDGVTVVNPFAANASR